MRITVTQEDIDNGKRRSCRQCPIALAVKRNVKTFVQVCPKTILVGYQSGGRRKLPQIAKDFIQAYDFGHPVSPFEFGLAVQ